MSGFDPVYRVLGDGVGGAAYPVFDLAVFLLCLIDDDVHPIFEVKGVGRGGGRRG
jgi:hypothetical protein